MVPSRQSTPPGGDAVVRGVAAAVRDSAPDGVPARSHRVVALLARHWLFSVILVAGVVLRVLLTVAYWPAFWFWGDSGAYLRASAQLGVTGNDGANGAGYPFFLALLRWTGSLAVIPVLQHIACLLLAVAVYVFLLRNGLPAWLAAIGAAPIPLDGRQAVLEHYVLGDAVFTVLLTTAVLLLVWRRRPATVSFLVSAVLLVAAVITRTVGVGACAVVMLYPLLRWAGWRRVLVFAGGMAVVLGGYLGAREMVTGSYAISGAQGHYLYSRTAQIADCSRLRLNPEQRALCPAEPLGQRPERGDWYLWNSPALQQAPDAVAGSFAKQVILQQPGDYAAMVLRDTARYLLPGNQDPGPATTCANTWWTAPSDLRTTLPYPYPGRCIALLASTDGFTADPADPNATGPTPLRSFLSGYTHQVQTPHLALGLAVLLAVVALVWRRGRRGWREDLPAALLVGAGLALLVLAVATSMYSARYGLPTIPMMIAGGVLALHRLCTVRHRTMHSRDSG